MKDLETYMAAHRVPHWDAVRHAVRMGAAVMLSAHDVNTLLEEGLSPNTGIVLGNESCDMDSIISSIVYAAYLTYVKNERYVPVLNIPREDLALRVEAVWALTDAGIDVDKLLFFPELDLDAVDKVVLVDHNELPAGNPAACALADKVVEIIDHHEDKHVRGAAVERAVVKVCGSCASLVAMTVMGGDAGHDQAVPDPGAVPREGAVCAPAPELARLLLITVLLDTVMHSEKAKKSTMLDVFITAMMASLGFAQFDEHPKEMQTLLLEETFKKAERARFDVSRLTLPQTLRKDYKQWKWGATTVGIAAVTEPFTAFDAKGDVQKECDEFRAARGLDLLLIMGLYRDAEDNIVKSVAMSPDHPALLAAFTEGALKDALELVPTPGHALTSFEQRNVAISRKTLTPMLDPFFAGL
eukprot:TRINITY_DN22644_c0_g1_i1.p2 TRINITY_DN22644_c0_g1~~TRINITY_DN22644_c0_g1_i1.p2  ORF type:complete len:413 (+),score=164.65 TRINITY_DN22644_c0_g1_i1:38-1276(+)